MTGPDPDPDPLSGLRVLVVEDETLVSMLLEDCLEDLGCQVAGVASDVGDGVAKASSLEIDAAVLDVNLGGQLSYPVAQALRLRGVPFVFVTGYGVAGLPEALRDVPVIAKPFTAVQVGQTLRTALRLRAERAVG